MTDLFGIINNSYRYDWKCGDTETLTEGLNHLIFHCYSKSFDA